MAARAQNVLEDIVSINVEEQQMSLAEFFSLCRQSVNVSTKDSPNKYYIILVFRGIPYHCSIILDYYGVKNEFALFFYNKHDPTYSEIGVLNKKNTTNFCDCK